MAKQYLKVATLNMWKNDAGKRIAGNNGWTPFVNGSANDILLKSDQKYQVSLFENDDGKSYNVTISKVIDPYENVEFDKISDAPSQEAMQELAKTLESKED
tara:strand:- start:1113 stop:1415 length:303 start_codon:yes stop_codon:yes gene_type:complete